MKHRPVVDAALLPRTMNESRHPLWMGVLMLIFIEASVLLTILASYGYLRLQSDTWPAPGAGHADPLIPTINLVLLLCSAFTMWWAGTGTKRGSRLVMAGGTTISVLLASVVLILRWIELGKLGYSWDDHAYGSITWLIFGFHFVHVTAAVLGTAVVSAFAWRGYYTKERNLGVVVDSLYWYFVAVAWLPLYYVTVWDPRIG